MIPNPPTPSATAPPKPEAFAPLLQLFAMPTWTAIYRDLLGFELHQRSTPLGPDDSDWTWLAMRLLWLQPDDQVARLQLAER